MGNRIWKSLIAGNLENVVELFNQALKPIPYDDFSENREKNGEERGEYWYRSLFVMLLNATDLIFYPEVHTFKGRSDVVVSFKDKLIVVIEFKFASTSKDVDKKRQEGEEQIKSRDYASAYKSTKKVITAVFVADDEKRQIVM